jgi:hypothetical protein
MTSSQDVVKYRLRLGETELDYLQQFLDAGDRGGFYLAYYSIVGGLGPEFGSGEMALQTRVATFSGRFGATANR